MERLPLPDYVYAKQQVTQLPNGEFARDRLMVVQKTEIVPLIDPVVTDYLIKQAAKQQLQDAVDQSMPGTMLIAGAIFLLLTPATFLFTMWLTR